MSIVNTLFRKTATRMSYLIHKQNKNVDKKENIFFLFRKKYI